MQDPSLPWFQQQMLQHPLASFGVPAQPKKMKSAPRYLSHESLQEIRQFTSNSSNRRLEENSEVRCSGCRADRMLDILDSLGLGLAKGTWPLSTRALQSCKGSCSNFSENLVAFCRTKATAPLPSRQIRREDALLVAAEPYFKPRCGVFCLVCPGLMWHVVAAFFSESNLLRLDVEGGFEMDGAELRNASEACGDRVRCHVGQIVYLSSKADRKERFFSCRV